ncbi:hypothetical protein L596_008840 [Steinernema carpocapsae]|uniref:Uncharacterized protein n=1 Tax=Steinernema carpocapsae TaxID=34508 RepID=A0A4V6A6I8_STECR|nr:hypothetical protein L596_008840 [Steinernema carpocapsae]
MMTSAFLVVLLLVVATVSASFDSVPNSLTYASSPNQQNPLPQWNSNHEIASHSPRIRRFSRSIRGEPKREDQIGREVAFFQHSNFMISV